MAENSELRDRKLIREWLGNVQRELDIAVLAEKDWKQGALKEAISNIERECHSIKLYIFPGGGFTFPE